MVGLAFTELAVDEEAGRILGRHAGRSTNLQDAEGTQDKLLSDGLHLSVTLKDSQFSELKTLVFPCSKFHYTAHQDLRAVFHNDKVLGLGYVYE